MIPVAGPRRVCALALAAFATFASVHAAPGRMDASKRATRLSPEEKAVLPENVPVERNEVLMDRRFQRGGDETIEKKNAIVGERRSGIAVEESEEKQLYRTPERKEYDVVERKDSVWSGKESRFSTGEDAYRSKVATRFQEKISDVRPFNDNVKPVVSQRTTFDRINRFAFRKNGDQSVSVSTAGSEQGSRDISGASAPVPGGGSGGASPPPAAPALPSSDR